MPGKDDDLLARLNALKPSSVKLDATPQPSFDVEISKPPLASVEDKLADRLKTLPDVLTSQIKDEVASEPLADWQQDGTEQSIDDLLAELETNEQAKLNPDDPEDVAALLREAQAALPPSHEPGEGGGDAGETTQNHPKEHDSETDEPDDEKSEDQQDQAQADDYVQKVLAELAIERKYGPADADERGEPDSPHDDDEEQPSRDDKNTLNLPSTPLQTTPPPPPAPPPKKTPPSHPASPPSNCTSPPHPPPHPPQKQKQKQSKKPPTPSQNPKRNPKRRRNSQTTKSVPGAASATRTARCGVWGARETFTAMRAGGRVMGRRRDRSGGIGRCSL
ncbi:hypothetical protein Q7P37_011536 [Cladosporium fusiforme]